MNVNKVTMHITVEVFSKDSISAMVFDFVDNLSKECYEGKIVKDDGDAIQWNTSTMNVTV